MGAKYLGHSPVHAGLQQHSIGDIYPWMLIVQSGASGHWLMVKNGITGEVGPEFYLRWNPELGEFDDERWANAHRSARQWIVYRESSAGNYVDGMRELSELA